jgi:hypothetical protein
VSNRTSKSMSRPLLAFLFRCWLEALLPALCSALCLGWPFFWNVRMDFLGHFRPESPTSRGQTTSAIPSGGGMLKFKGVVGNQVVEYVALIDDDGRNIVGG